MTDDEWYETQVRNYMGEKWAARTAACGPSAAAA